tara:strand:+ start:653 stop:1678 length:1026 start_codon:yes stop_codon:yes gene_type:complete
MKKIKKTILITGVAGFIGSFLAKKLLNENYLVIGIDDMNNYYDVKLKQDRMDELVIKNSQDNFKFYELSINNNDEVNSIFRKYNPNFVINLAAQAGVRYSITNPESYIQSNLVGFSNILESCRNFNVEHLIYASSSSVYGGNTSLPFTESQAVNHPVSLYAATKKANELMAHSYSHLYELPCTGLRLFTVYGPWGRPDMAPMIFAKAISSGSPIKVFNYGKMSRDFTYIDDVIDAISKIIIKIPSKDDNFDTALPNPSTSFAPSRIFNIGNNKPVKLLTFIDLIEKNLGKKALKNFEPLQSGDVISTFADIDNVKEWVDFNPVISIDIGIEKFIRWFKSYY